MVTYTAPDRYPLYSPPLFRAASSVTLRCVAEGASGSVSFQWTSTCSSCFASSNYSETISEQFLRSRDSGNHTCTATDSAGNTGSSLQQMTITGLSTWVKLLIITIYCVCRVHMSFTAYTVKSVIIIERIETRDQSILGTLS